MKTFTAGPGAPVTATVTNAKVATDPKPAPPGQTHPQPVYSGQAEQRGHALLAGHRHTKC
ncbi:hypothetical protein M2271_000675 [Streptomyces sp. LBL]|uniref:hypothetical protein n=1 Tax=Streptomyces sp. LBL TaxID=2940562 RepID=UPI00247419C7|nr:hypothetical protein [Streptomyces sp. LBL]MDH6622888.1 hypothetical protein [Streptomyces sp. LBL]